MVSGPGSGRTEFVFSAENLKFVAFLKKLLIPLL
jgi:hypothetical protein